MIGIIGAMKEEINSFTSHSTIEKKEKESGLNFYTGTLSGKKITIVQSGIGKVNAAIATQILINKYKVEKIIFTGLAGATEKNIAIGDYVLAQSLVQHDFDLSHFGREKGFVPGIGKFINTDKDLNSLIEKVILELDIKQKSFGKLHKGIIASGDAFIASRDKIEEIVSNFNAIAVEMEGASVAQVCSMNKIPFAILRTISDNADENALVDFQSVLDKASHDEFLILSNLLKII